ncbi:Glyoxalase/Bleomycin resistance protein/Dioxygenase superfamily protein [Aliiroseovarius sediminilitoris]|uniref:Glyoxalase/Bleomycin resistance protein/Dioxygenase superfamily protein n=1 Tax=Aliiroseovarius sediminilitoris TaxID=1173584 RepID=A0A1I0NDJ2_9RHOB|nr:Glyoxalase/Bleomycin resistance protein/Dioxygenase superfamily protein [Aliiroseovarius sediminilitoris]
MQRYTANRRGAVITQLHHVQLAMPKGQEDRAVRFYADLLGLKVEPKPDILAKRGGVWFRHGDVRVHLGVEELFTPAKKAHPAFLCDDLNALARTLEAAEFPVRWDEKLSGFRRFYTADPFGNRIEFLRSED